MALSAWVGGGGMRVRIVAARRRRSAAALAAEVAALRAAGTRAEVAALRAAGTRVLVLEPACADPAAIGTNTMARDRRIEVVEAARASTERTPRRIGRRRLGRIGLAVS